MYPDDHVLVAVMNNQPDWDIVIDQGWYRIPLKHAPLDVPYVDWLAFYFTAKFGSDKWAIHYYAAVEGHELVTRADLFPDQPNHPRAEQQYYKLMLGPLQHKLPPIISNKWRRITFIVTTGDRFENAIEVNDLFGYESPLGQLYVTLKEEGFLVEQYWTVKEDKGTYEADLAIKEPAGGWQYINLTSPSQPHPDALRLSETMSLADCVATIKKRMQ